MSPERSTVHSSTGAPKSTDLKAGSRVDVTFGSHAASGVVLGKTITGRYAVEVHIDGADEPVRTSYPRSELRIA